MMMSMRFDKVTSLLSPFIQRCDDLPKCASSLVAEDRAAFLPARDFWRSYCRSAEELKSLELYQIEEAKELLSYGVGPALSEATIYRSPYLSELREQRDSQNGVVAERLAERYSDPLEVLVRKECHPGLKRLVRERCFDFASYERKWRVAQLEIEGVKKNEIKRLRSVILSDYGISKLRRETTKEILQLIISNNLGVNTKFEIKDRTATIFFSQNDLYNFKLNFKIDKYLKNFSIGDKSHSNWMNYSLYISNYGEFEKIDIQNGNSIMLRYGVLMPGFSNSYENYRCNAEFILNITTHALFLRNWIFAGNFETRSCNSLGDGSIR